ncbi:MAG TPA: efflux RND transporter periplasmic adaptor subunit [Vicinamibacterales bacterium]|nr:efflux RND transporter periplasmic adaptor subunit [Vicinamibacterales bacterium]
MKKTIITLVVIAAIAATVGGYYYTRPGPEPRVTTATVTRGDITDNVGATGTLDAVTSVTVGSQVSGIIQELYADFNSIVRKGQVIARLDPTMIQTQIEQARANLVRAEADLERLKVTLEDARSKLTRARELHERKLITQAELETAQVNVKSAEAQLRSSQASLSQSEASLRTNQVNLEHTVIQAPIDGIVVSRNVEIGQTVAASFNAPTLFIIAADLTKMKCTANIDESDVGRIRPGQPVRFRVDAYPTEEFQGVVSQVRLQPIVVQNVVTYGTVIDVPNPALKLKPGMTANVQIEIAKRTNVLRVPNATVRYRPSAEIFQALNQPVPPELLQQQRGNGSRMAGGAGGSRGMGRPNAGGEATPAAPSAPEQASAPAPAARPASGTAPAPAAAAGAPGERGGGDRAQGDGGPGRERGPGGEGMGAGGNRGFDPNDPERRARMMERLQQMPEAERAQFLARMKERGVNLDAPAGAGAVPPARAAAGASRGRAASVPAMASGTATTIDALFAPLPPTSTFGRAWIWLAGQKQLKGPVRLRLGISDGQFTELIEGDVQEGQELVTGVQIGDQVQARPGAGNSASPLMQQRGGPPGGFGGPR